MSKRSILVAGLCLLLSACETGGRPSPYAIVRFEAASPGAQDDKTALREYQVDLKRLLWNEIQAYNLFGTSGDSFKPGPFKDYTFTDLVTIVESSATTTQKKAIRDTATGQLLLASEVNCNLYLQSLRGAQVSSRTTSDFLAGSFGAAGALTSPLRNANILASLASLSTVYGATIDRDIFSKEATEVVAAAIDKQRLIDRGAIEGKLQQDYASYPLGSAVTDIYNFHEDCSLLRGLTFVSDAINARDADIQTIRAAAAANIPTAVVAQLINPHSSATPATPSPASPPTTPPAPPASSSAATTAAAAAAKTTAALLTRDLDSYIQTAGKCVDDVENAVSSMNTHPATADAKDKKPDSLHVALQAPDCLSKDLWIDQFLALARGQFLDLKKNPAVDQKIVTDVSNAKYPLGMRIAEIESTRVALAKSTAALRARIASVRNARLAAAAAIAAANGQASDVRAVLEGGDGLFKAPDPMLGAIRAALAQIDDSQESGAAAAALAAALSAAYTAPATSAAGSSG